MAIDLTTMKAELYQELLKMEFTIKDKDGNPQTVSPDPTNNNLLPLAQAITNWAFKLVTQEISVITNAGQPVSTDNTSGLGATIGPGTGTLK